MSISLASQFPSNNVDFKREKGEYDTKKAEWASKAKEYEQWRDAQYKADAEYARQHPIESLDHRWWAVLGVVLFGMWSYKRKRGSVKGKQNTT